MKVSDNAGPLRKQYIPPRLTQYGSIRELTKGGTAGPNENSASWQTGKKP